MEMEAKDRGVDPAEGRKKSATQFIQNIVLLFISVSFTGIGYLSFAMPELLSNLPENPWVWILLLLGFSAALSLIYRIMSSSRRIDVVDADQEVFVSPTGIPVILSDGTTTQIPIDSGLFKAQVEDNDRLRNGELPVSANLDTPFERYVNNIVRALDSRINQSELKAAVLLQQGKNYIFGGIVFNVLTIAIWHVVEHNYGFSYFLLAGIASTSMTFLVIEFLAAWFLKQYRSYVDASVLYLKVRSVFNRYLLIYYSVNQFPNDDSLRQTLVDVLNEDVKWPSHKEITSNDFNYMIEAVGAFTNIVDKLKSEVSGKSDKSGGQPQT